MRRQVLHKLLSFRRRRWVVPGWWLTFPIAHKSHLRSPRFRICIITRVLRAKNREVAIFQKRCCVIYCFTLHARCWPYKDMLIFCEQFHNCLGIIFVFCTLDWLDATRSQAGRYITFEIVIGSQCLETTVSMSGQSSSVHHVAYTRRRYRPVPMETVYGCD